MSTQTAIPVKLVTLLILCGLITACTTKIAYNYLDWIIEWYVSDLVTLNDDQEWHLAEAIDQELLWHRRTQLPSYVDSLEQLSNDIKRGLTFNSLNQFYQTNENAWFSIKRHATPEITRLLKKLSNSQVDELLDNLEQENRDLEEEYVNKPLNERIEQRRERMTDRIESWTGDLNEKQKQLIDNWSRQIKPLSEQWIATRRAWQKSLADILQNYRDKPEFDKLIHDLFYNSRKFWPQWYHDAFYKNVHLTLSMFTDLSKQFTEEQTQHVLDELNRLRRNLQELQQETP